MARLTKAYYSRFHVPKTVRAKMTLDEVRKFQVDFNSGLESETVTSATWQNENTDQTLSIASATLSAGIASCLGEARIEGTAKLYCSATLDTGRKLKQWFHVRIKDEADVR